MYLGGATNDDAGRSRNRKAVEFDIPGEPCPIYAFILAPTFLLGSKTG